MYSKYFERLHQDEARFAEDQRVFRALRTSRRSTWLTHLRVAVGTRLMNLGQRMAYQRTSIASR